MSLLDTIQQAEAQAAEAKKQAAIQSREIIHSSEQQAREEAAQIIDYARKQATAAVEFARIEAKNKADAMNAQKSSENELAAANARKLLPKAVSTIVERVVK